MNGSSSWIIGSIERDFWTWRSRSNVAVLAPRERQALLGQISALWDEEPELRGQTRVKLAYLIRVRRARRLRPHAHETGTVPM